MFKENIDMNGIWDFAYVEKNTTDNDGLPRFIDDKEYQMHIKVPAWWDDEIDIFKQSKTWNKVKFNPHHVPVELKMSGSDLFGERYGDGSLPHIIGAGWYRKNVFIKKKLEGTLAALEIGGVSLEAWIYINGAFAGHHLGHSTGFTINIEKYLKYGQNNEIVICVDNTSEGRIGTAIRGFKGTTGGIYKSVNISFAKKAKIRDTYLRILNNKIKFDCVIRGEYKDLQIGYSIKSIRDGRVMECGVFDVCEENIAWEISLDKIELWSEYNPILYEVEICLLYNDECLDKKYIKKGFRIIQTDGMKIKINGVCTFLRGATDHCYWPLTCTIPTDKQFYLDVLSKVKQLGFNWLRCHTWTPPSEYLEAADELGLMVQVEAPVNFTEEEWTDICMACRNHASVVIYCCGNEEYFDEEKIEYFGEIAKLTKKLVPDALFNPHEAFRGIEYRWTAEEESGDWSQICEEPVRHNPGKLKKVEAYADVLGQYANGEVSYHGIDGTHQGLDRQLSIYSKPCLTHELGIQGTYLDIGLESRYEHLRIGPDMFKCTRIALEEKGLIQRAGDYYEYSCKSHRLSRKHIFETARKSKILSGYDFLGPNDSHWARTGYPCGMMNEFFELKPGETYEQTKTYNSDAVVLLDVNIDRNYYSGAFFEKDIYVSNFSPIAFTNAKIKWYLEGNDGKLYKNGVICGLTIQNEKLTTIDKIKFSMPEVETATYLKLKVYMCSNERVISNEWIFYCFPCEKDDEREVERLKGIYREQNCRLVNDLDDETLDFLEDGGKVVLIGTSRLKYEPITHHYTLAGRPHGIQATIIHSHPSMKEIPHQGFCDYLFFDFMKDSVVYNFDYMPEILYSPIIEVASSFKNVKKLGALFEVNVGKGKLLACSLNITPQKTGGVYFIKKLADYLCTSEMVPANSITKKQLKDILKREDNPKWSLETDMGLDVNMEKYHKKLQETINKKL